MRLRRYAGPCADDTACRGSKACVGGSEHRRQKTGESVNSRAKRGHAQQHAPPITLAKKPFRLLRVTLTK
eukprot:9022384-Pyramimonas_sp.AAC.1